MIKCGNKRLFLEHFCQTRRPKKYKVKESIINTMMLENTFDKREVVTLKIYRIANT